MYSEAGSVRAGKGGEAVHCCTVRCLDRSRRNHGRPPSPPPSPRQRGPVRAPNKRRARARRPKRGGRGQEGGRQCGGRTPPHCWRRAWRRCCARRRFATAQLPAGDFAVAAAHGSRVGGGGAAVAATAVCPTAVTLPRPCVYNRRAQTPKILVPPRRYLTVAPCASSSRRTPVTDGMSPRHVTAPTPRLPPTTGTDRRPTGDADGRKGEYEGRAALLKVREGQRGAEEQVHTASDAPTNCDGRETCRTSRLTGPSGPLVSGSPRPLTLDKKKNILCLFPVSVTFFEPTGSAAR